MSGVDKLVSLSANSAGHISSTKQMKVLLRSIMPYGTTSTATPYVFKLDRVYVTGQQ
jgi:hypothetical protein